MSECDVAIIGMSCRFPESPDIETYWARLRAGAQCITYFDDESLRAAGVSDELRRDPAYVPAGGVLNEVERFDAELFGMLPREAILVDPQQRIFLEASWAALEDAGYAPRGIEGRRVGVYAGATMNTYLASLLKADPALVERYGEQTVMLANDKDFLPLRASYKLGLTGPSLNIQAACATSLVAVHAACRSLLCGECDMALAGAASVRAPHRVGYMHQEYGTSSRDGRCCAFDADADGSVPGSGVGVVILKRLAEALEDGDSIRAVIKGTGVNNDGAAKASFTAPSADGMARAVVDAFATAQISAETVSYVECHGTATKLGDPIEVRGLTRAFREMTEAVGFCGIGSVKPNIGHLDAAAGMAGLIKTVLALEHTLIPPTLHFRRPNPELRLDETPFHVVGQAAEWKAPPGGGRRRAGVNSIGMGGVNAHVIVEEAPPQAASSTKRRWFALPLSGRTSTALAASTTRLAAHLAAADSRTPEDRDSLADVAFTLQTGRAQLAHRRAIVCGLEGSVPAPQHAAERPGVVSASDASVVYLFPGQGSQHPRMGSELYRTNEAFRAAFGHCSQIVRELDGPDLHELLIEPGAPAEALQSTAVAQPAMFVTGWALAAALADAGVVAGRLIGHSVGEFLAAAWAGVFSLEDALALIVERGRLAEATPVGGMTAVAAAEERVTELVAGFPDDGLSLAAVNAPGRCVVAGAVPAIQEFEGRLAPLRIGFKRLPIDRAFHSPMMESAALAFAKAVESRPPGPPDRPVYSARTGQSLTEEEAMSPSYWGRQLRDPVCFSAAARRALEGGSVLAIECGPGTALTGLARAIAPDAHGLAPLPRPVGGGEAAEERAFQEVLARSWERGVPVRWGSQHVGETRRRVSLPSYPFEGNRAWIDAPTPAMATPVSSPSAGVVEPREQAASTTLAGTLNAELAVYADHIVIRTNPARTGARNSDEVDAVRHPASPVPSVAENGADPPGSHDIESQIAVIVEELVGVANIDRQAKLTELGADSLLLTQLLSRLRMDVAPALTMNALMQHGSVAELAGLVRANGGRPDSPPSEGTASHVTQARSKPAPSLIESDSVDGLVAELRGFTPEEIERELELLGASEDDGND